VFTDGLISDIAISQDLWCFPKMFSVFHCSTDHFIFDVLMTDSSYRSV
jgi:hypothetical protein